MTYPIQPSVDWNITIVASAAILLNVLRKTRKTNIVPECVDSLEEVHEMM